MTRSWSLILEIQVLRVQSSMQSASSRALTARAIVIGIACAAFFCAITPVNDFKIAATYIAGTQFPIGALFVLFVLAGVINPVLRMISPRRAFATGELLVIWTLMLVVSGVPSSGMMRYFLPQIAAPQYYSNTTNNWEAKIWQNTPAWLNLTTKADADAYFKGYLRGEEHIPWQSWATPLLAWGVPSLCFFVATFCVCNLLRRQWIENEKFAFPLVTLPILLSELPEGNHTVPALLRNPMLWTGFLLVSALHTVRGLHVLYPAIPDIPFSWNVMDFLRVSPWNQIGPIDATIWPMVIGFAYLLPGEVGLSLWFWHVFYKGEILTAAIYNLPTAGPLTAYNYKAFHGLEAFGGAVALLSWTLYTARQHLRDVWQKAIGGKRATEIDDSGEMVGYRTTVILLAASYLGIAVFLLAAGVEPLVMVSSLLMLTLALVVISWVVSQAGLLFMATPYATLDALAEPFGTAPFRIGSLYTNARWENMFLYDTREMMAPSILMGTKTADSARIPLRGLLAAMLLTVVICVGVSLVASLQLPYFNGGGLSINNPFTYRDAPLRPLQFLGGVADLPRPPSGWAGLHIVAGFVGVGALLVLRAAGKFALHPVGFCARRSIRCMFCGFRFFSAGHSRRLCNDTAV